MRVRTHLSLLAAAVFLPMIVGAGVAIKLLLDAERHAVLRGMQELARASVLAMDQELTAAIASGQALATSARLKQGDFEYFYRQARSANAGTSRETAVLREDGQQLFNTVVPYGQPIAPPPPGALQRVADVFERQRPTVSNLIVGSATRRYVISAELPLTLDDGRRVLLDQWFDAQHLNRLLPRDVPASWQVSVFDRDGAALARNEGSSASVGARASPELLRALRSGAARTELAGRDGAPMAAALARSSLSGWTAVIGVPVRELEATAARAVSLTAATLLCAVVLALAGAILFARRLLAATEYLGAATEGMAEGWLPPPADLRIAELNSLQQVLHAVSRRLQKAEAGRRKHLAEVQAARSVAEAQNRAKDEFLAMLGHELRNPLGAISSAIDLIQMGAGGGAAERAHQIIGRQSRHLAHLVDELLDANRVLSGKVVLALAPLDLAVAVREAALTLQTQGTTAGHELTLDLEPLWVNGDPTRLQQVIGNLVENAAKYTQAGGHIHVSTRRRGGMAELVVRDDGKGIDAELLPRVWDVFVQGKVSSRAKGGLGIGLAVVKSLVEQQHGSVAVVSAGAGQGSSFTVRLPLAQETPAAAELPAPVTTALDGLRVLVVEDNEDLREMMCALLASRGCAVDSAADGRSAIALAANALPQVAFVDIDLPDIAGHEVARALAGQGGIRLVAVTGYGQPEDVRRALAAGFDRHLKKPVRLEDLERAIGEMDLVR
ncbi:Sensor protein TorS [Massilia sp. Bi118]|uniref:hybrid sensor histidine kinase/response regulator n=1 Tax=Massilia sp. Bi118 TaxID=2822346 RepID=UPI001D402E44|nr:ATP-binding protein [Massilia sp. Bi118]CAH0170824.1 Sensor protein TorS [Massilia sp. Bi118]